MRPAAISDLSTLLRRLAATHGERLAVCDEQTALGFRALDGRADAWAATVLARGCGPGAHVALFAGNGPEWLAVAFGVWRAGATLVPLSTFVTAEELGGLLADADVDVLVIQPRLRSRDLLAVLRDADRPPRLREVIVLGAEAGLPDAVSCGASRPAAGAPPDSDSIACILYTSGTEARPKGVMLSHRALLATIMPTVVRSGLDETDRMLATPPLFWVAGLAIRALPTLTAGAALILPETFTPDAVIELLERHRPTALHLRPAQVALLLEHPRFRLSLLAGVCKGTGRLPWEHPELGLAGARFITGYGMTEMAGYVACLDARDLSDVERQRLGTPLPGVEIRVVDTAGRDVGPGDVGEIRVRGPGLFSGYYGQAGGEAPALDERGFFATGDLGCVELEGFVDFTGRAKDLLRVGGINVSPLEIEAVLGRHGGVEAAYVVGLPPDGLEQRIVALVVRSETDRASVQAAEAALRAHAAHSLSHYKRPQRYLFVHRDEVPLGATSKARRVELAALAAARERAETP